jgi:mRNA-degrading endonuclease RelE of RelBE toxin-antitoxin system
MPPSITHSPTYDRDLRRAKLGPKTQQALQEAWLDIVAAVTENPNNPDARAGDPIPGNNLEVYKLRIADPDHNTGKRGGYRLIYLWLKAENRLAGLLFYRKSEKENVVQAEVAAARKRLGG